MKGRLAISMSYSQQELKRKSSIYELKLLVVRALTRFGYSEAISYIDKEDSLHEVVDILDEALNKITELEEEIN